MTVGKESQEGTRDGEQTPTHGEPQSVGSARPATLVLRTLLPSALNLGKEQTERKDGKRNQSRSELGEQQSREKKNTKTFKKVQLRSDDRLVEGN